MSFRLKLVAGVAVIEASMLGVTLGAGHLYTSHAIQAEFRERASVQAQALTAAAADAVLSRDLAKLDALVDRALDPAGGGVSHLRIMRADGQVLAEGGSPAALASAAAADATLADAKRDGRYDVVRAVRLGELEIGRLAFGLPTAAAEARLRDVVRMELALAAVVLGLSMVLAYGLGTALARRQERLRDLANQLRRGAVADQVTIGGADEIGRTAAVLRGMARDMDAFRRAAEDEAATARDALARERAAAAQQRGFVAMLSHQFRTPLAVISGKARQIARAAHKNGDDQISSKSNDIERSVQRLVELMETVLLNAKWEQGEVTATLAEHDLHDVIAECVATAEAAFPDRDFRFHAACAAPTLLDATLMRQVVGNLLSNAAKYSDPGARVDIALVQDADGALRVTVSDEGVGIPPEEVDRLFQRFFRASTADGRPGTGLGLHMTRAFVEMHGGRMTVASRVGCGSTFGFVLPPPTALSPAAAPAVAAA